eukprot:2985866-Prymnesium_polylepis.1
MTSLCLWTPVVTCSRFAPRRPSRTSTHPMTIRRAQNAIPDTATPHTQGHTRHNTHVKVRPRWRSPGAPTRAPTP